MADEPIAFRLYSRVNCHLCEQMIASLVSAQESYSYTVEVIDIDKDSELQKKFNADVPVLAYKNEIVCAHFMDFTLLEAFLEEHT